MDKMEMLKNVIPMEYIKKIKKLKALKNEIATLEASFKDVLKDEMHNNNIIEMSVDGVRFRYIASYEKSTFDTKAFALKHPKMYNDYLKQQHVDDTIRTTIG